MLTVAKAATEEREATKLVQEKSAFDESGYHEQKKFTEEKAGGGTAKGQQVIVAQEEEDTKEAFEDKPTKNKQVPPVQVKLQKQGKEEEVYSKAQCLFFFILCVCSIIRSLLVGISNSRMIGILLFVILGFLIWLRKFGSNFIKS